MIKVKDSELKVSLSSDNGINADLAISKVIKGIDGKDGYTPIKGVDYFTEEDIESLKDIFALKDHTHDGNASQKAICGEFLCGELKVGQGLDINSKSSGKWIDNVTPVNAENLNAIESKILEHQKALDELLYKDLVINLSANKSTTLEKGTIINEVVFTWNYNKDIISQSFNGSVLESNLRSFTYNSEFSSNKTFSLKANDGKKDFTKSISFSFLNGRYWGVSNGTTYDSDFIRGLSKELSSGKGKTFTVNCGQDQHIYYCIPTNFGTPVFTVGGFSGGFNKVSTVQYENSHGYTESYDIWKSANSNLGNTTVVVS